MIRPITCICVLLAGGSGLYIYQTKHRTRLLDQQIEQTMKQVEAARARIGMLQAEWALLNQPERLSDLADRFLALKAVAPTQFVTLADLDRHLPAPLPASPTPAAAGTDEGADAGEPPVAATTAEAASVPLAAAEPPSSPAPAPSPPEEPASAHRAAVRHEPAQAERRPAPAQHNANAAEAPGPVAVAAARGALAAAPHPHAGGAHAQAIAAAAGPRAPGIRPQPANAPVPVVGSVLGAARVVMAPPVPLSGVAAWSGAR